MQRPMLRTSGGCKKALQLVPLVACLCAASQANLPHARCVGACRLLPLQRTLGCHCTAVGCRREGGEEAYRQWRELERLMQPLQARSRPAAAIASWLPALQRHACAGRAGAAQANWFFMRMLPADFTAHPFGCSAGGCRDAACRCTACRPRHSAHSGPLWSRPAESRIGGGAADCALLRYASKRAGTVASEEGCMCRRWRSTCLCC